MWGKYPKTGYWTHKDQLAAQRREKQEWLAKISKRRF